MFQIRLKQLRENLGLSQRAFAEVFGVAQSTIGMWESGKREPDLSTIERIANYFDVTVDYLLGREEKPSENSNDLSTKIIETFNRLDDEKQKQALEYLEFLAARDNQEK